MSDEHDDSTELSLSEQLEILQLKYKESHMNETNYWKWYREEEAKVRTAEEEVKNLKSELAENKIELASMKYEVIDAKADERVSANSIHTMQSTIRIILQEAIDGTARNS